MVVPSTSTLTPAQQKMNDLWDEHVRCEFADHDVEATLKTMCKGAYVHNVATMTGGRELPGVQDFYAYIFLPQLPPDTETTLISRTIGDTQIVDELIFKFTHTVPMAWMLPGVNPTGKRVEVPLVAIIGFREGKISHEHIYWDQASVLVQVGLIDPENLPVNGIASAQTLNAITVNLKIRKIS